MCSSARLANSLLIALCALTGALLPMKVTAQACPSAAEVRADLKLAYIDGMFVVGEGSPDGQALMRLAAWHASPQMVDEIAVRGGMKNAMRLATDILPPRSEALTSFTSAGSFRGKTPEERAQSQARFLAACGGTMTELAPKAPFHFAIAKKGVIGDYKDKRGGVTIPPGPNYLSRAFYSDFLEPNPMSDFVKTDSVWLMTPAEAEALHARVAAMAPYPAARRQVQAVAIVEVKRIDPLTRAADVELVEFALYDVGFSQKLFAYDQAADQKVQGSAATTAPPTSGALPVGVHATRQAAVEHALALCEENAITATEVRCDCLAEHVGEEWTRNPQGHIANLSFQAMHANKVECRNVEAQRARALRRCADADWPPLWTRTPSVNLRLDRREYCHCIADRSVEIGLQKAMYSCVATEDYPVPADSPIRD
jgi:hypothetical protein